MNHLVRALLVACLAVVAEAQSADALIGDWRLVSNMQLDSTDVLRPQWGPRPLGMIRYSANGVMSAQLYDERRPSLGSATPSPDAALTALSGMASYYGTYVVDTVAKTVTHRIEGAMRPELVGRSAVRSYRFLTADRIELRALTNLDGQPSTRGQVLVWERVPADPPGAP